MLRGLDGTTIRKVQAAGGDVRPLLVEAGVYLKRMHEIIFKYSGYVDSPVGPKQPPDPKLWRHIHWDVDALEATAKERWREALENSHSELHLNLRQLFDLNRPAIADCYNPPRFMPGDCHVDQFFFKDGKVTGVVDMEVASAGACIGDLVKFAIEGAANLQEDKWWSYFFKGYGDAIDFNIFKVRLLCSEFREFECQNWKGSYAEILNRVYNANSWEQLFECGRTP